MKFGLAPVQWNRYWSWTVKEVLLAEKLGFSSVWMFEHHGRGDAYYPSPLIALAGLASVTKRMELGTCVLLLPLYHPVHVAEDSAVIDVMSNGRFILGVGLGYRRKEYELFQISMKGRGSRMTESIKLIRELWTKPTVSFRGRFFNVENFSLEPKPVRKPHPPIWIGGWSRRALRRAAELGDAWLIGPVGSMRSVLDGYRVYMGFLEKLDRRVEIIPLTRDCYVAEDSVEAYGKASRYIGSMYFRDYASWNHPLVSGLKTFEELARDRFIIGNPDECISQIERIRKRLNVTDLILRVHYPGMSIEEGLEVIKLIGERIIPYFED